MYKHQIKDKSDTTGWWCHISDHLYIQKNQLILFYLKRGSFNDHELNTIRPSGDQGCLVAYKLSFSALAVLPSELLSCTSVHGMYTACHLFAYLWKYSVAIRVLVHPFLCSQLFLVFKQSWLLHRGVLLARSGAPPVGEVRQSHSPSDGSSCGRWKWKCRSLPSVTDAIKWLIFFTRAYSKGSIKILQEWSCTCRG